MHPISFSMEKSSVKIKDMRNKKERERQKRKRRMGCDSHTKGCVWVGGVVVFFLRYHPLKAHTTLSKSKKYMLFSKRCGSFLKKNNHTSHPNTLNLYGHHMPQGGLVVRAWDQEVCSLCGLRFEPCGCSYDGYWRLTWLLISGPVGLVEVRAS